MTALSVSNHVAITLSALEQLAINDHVTLEAAGVYGPAAQMAARADRWRTLGEVAILLDEDPHFAKAYAAAAVARSAALAAARHPGDATLAAEAVDAEQTQLEVAADPRAAVLADARRMLDFLAANPELPVDSHSLEATFHTSGTDAERMEAVDQAAELLGAEAANHGPAGYHYQVSKKFGDVRYGVVAVPSDRAYAALARTDVLRSDGPVAGVLLVPPILDEDQPVPPPAVPAHGHGQDDGGPESHPVEAALAAGYSAEELDGTACNRCGQEFAVNEASVPSGLVGGRQTFAHFDCVNDNDLATALLLDDDALVSHAYYAQDGGPLCGDTEPDPVFSNMPTCPTCSSLRAADRAHTEQGDSQ